MVNWTYYNSRFDVLYSKVCTFLAVSESASYVSKYDNYNLTKNKIMFIARLMSRFQRTNWLSCSKSA